MFMSEKENKERAEAVIIDALREYLRSLDHRMQEEQDPAIASIIFEKIIDIDYWFGVWVGDEDKHIMPRKETRRYL
jgi:hypothetical protein